MSGSVFIQGKPTSGGNAYAVTVNADGTLAVSGTFTPSGTSPEFTPVAAAAATATAGVLLGGQYDSTQKTLTNGQQSALSASARGALFVAIGADGFAATLAAGSAIVGQVGIDQTTPGTTNGVTIAPTAGAAAGIAAAPSTALETGHVIKASAGNLYGLNVMSTTVSGMVLVFNSTTVPAAGAVTPVKAYNLPANSTLVVGFDPPLKMTTGISVAFSSNTATPFTKADSATAFISGDAV